MQRDRGLVSTIYEGETEDVVKRYMWVTAVLFLAISSLGSALQAQSTDALIEEAVSPLPEDLRAEATVVTYDAVSGERKVLRQGTNFIECQPKNPDTGFTRCYHNVQGPRRNLQATLGAQGKSDEEAQAALAAAVDDGTVPARPQGSMSYRRYHDDDRIQYLWVMSLPHMTSDLIGVSTTPQRDSSLRGQGLPWLMRPGTSGAHVMIPINPRPTTSTITDVADDEIAQAVLPLPEELRDGATVYTYNRETGARQVLRQGTNDMECQPRDAESLFTRCQHKITGSRRDLQAKLRAEGKSSEEVTAAVAAAVTAGTVNATPFGMVSYRLYGKDDRIQYLWVMSVPNATSESIGVSTAGQRDASLRLEGLPWLMRAGTPAAHIMIPINK